MEIPASWDPWKALINLRRHGVSFHEAQTAFRDPFAVVIDDEAHSLHESRSILIGTSTRGRLLVVVHVDHGDTVRILSARRPASAERQAYEEA